MESRRLVGIILLMMTLSLWFALTPSREVRSTRQHVASSDFTHTSRGDLRKQFALSLALEEGMVFRIEEESKESATTRNTRGSSKSSFEVLARTSYRTRVEMELRVMRVLEDRIECECTMLDFVGYEIDEENKDINLLDKSEDNDDEEDNYDGDSRLQGSSSTMREMFERVRERTRNVKFGLVLKHDGTIMEMDSSKLRAEIISGLHEAGQLPMHLEHAVVVNAGELVFMATGASFGPMGKTSIRAKSVLLLKSTACEDQPGLSEKYFNRLVVVDRGGCTFQQKALLAFKHLAAGLIIIDREQTGKSESVVTYMSGEGDVPIVSVICNLEAGLAIEARMRLSPDFLETNAEEYVASGEDIVEILGGLPAVMALHKEEFEPMSSSSAPDDGTHLNPINSDGLNDFVGIGYVVDEVIRNRFSIFPQGPVNIGSSWQRVLMVHDKINPEVQAKVMETFTLSSISRAEADFSFGKKGDLIAEIAFEQREVPFVADKKDRPTPTSSVVNTRDANIVPQFGRPSLRGHAFKTRGVFQVHVPTGMVFAGSSRATSSSIRYVVVENAMNQKKNTVKAKVDLNAETVYVGSLQI